MELLTDLVSYWRLEEASGTRVDAHANHDLTDNNTVGQATGILGQAASFTATNSESLSVANNAELQLGDEDFSFACWVKMTSSSSKSRHVLAKYSGGAPADQDVRLTISTGLQPILTVANGTLTGSVTGDAITLNTWAFLYVEHDATADTLGVSTDNATMITSSYSGGAGDRTGVLQIGRGFQTDTLNFWQGPIDEFGFWKRTLTAVERTQLYNSGAGLTYNDFSSLTGQVLLTGVGR